MAGRWEQKRVEMTGKMMDDFEVEMLVFLLVDKWVALLVEHLACEVVASMVVWLEYLKAA